MTKLSEVQAPAANTSPRPRGKRHKHFHPAKPDERTKDLSPVPPPEPGGEGLSLRDQFDRLVELRSYDIVKALVDRAARGNLKAIAIVLANAKSFQSEVGGIKTVFEGIRLELSPGSAVSVERVLRDSTVSEPPRDVPVLSEKTT